MDETREDEVYVNNMMHMESWKDSEGYLSSLYIYILCDSKRLQKQHNMLFIHLNWLAYTHTLRNDLKYEAIHLEKKIVLKEWNSCCSFQWTMEDGSDDGEDATYS